jgi:hypothetical protein
MRAWAETLPWRVWRRRWQLAAATVACAMAAVVAPTVWRDAAGAVATAGAYLLLIAGPVLAWLGLAHPGRPGRRPVAVILGIAVLGYFLTSQLSSGEALAPPAADWVLPAGWWGTALCVSALLLQRMRWGRRPHWPELGASAVAQTLRRTVGGWALAGALTCSAAMWATTPDGVPARFRDAVAAADLVPVPSRWTVLEDDRTCRESWQCEHRLRVRIPADTSNADAPAVFREAMRQAGWAAQCRPMRGNFTWADRCLHLYPRAGSDFVVVVDERPGSGCERGDLVAAEPAPTFADLCDVRLIVVWPDFLVTHR